KERIKVKQGTRFDIEAVFDNSSSNPNQHSNPPIDVRFGEQTTNEMLFGFIGATKDNPKSAPQWIILQRPVFDAPRRWNGSSNREEKGRRWGLCAKSPAARITWSLPPCESPPAPPRRCCSPCRRGPTTNRRRPPSPTKSPISSPAPTTSWFA